MLEKRRILQPLSREELIRIIVDQRRQIQRLEQEVERLKKRTSAAPFSKGTRKKNPRRPGRRPGQRCFRRREPPPLTEPPVRVPIAETCCPDCGGPLGEPHEELVTTTDLPVPPPPKVQAFAVEVRHCQQCGKAVRGRHPAVAADQYGATAHQGR
jgi:hypothetical protein